MMRAVLTLAALAAAGPAFADPNRLAGPEWRVTEIAGAALPQGVEATISFSGDGRIAGRSGCNRYFGGVTLGEGTIVVSAVGGTRMACPGPAMETEARFLSVLQQAQAWTIADGGRLIITARDGRTIAASR